jgi:hypothetical protein
MTGTRLGKIYPGNTLRDRNREQSIDGVENKLLNTLRDRSREQSIDGVEYKLLNITTHHENR